MTKQDILDILTPLNRSTQPMQLSMFADLFLEYRAAMANIAEHGSVVLHPRTGEPCPNPYLPIRDKAMANLLKFRLKTPSSMWD